MSSIPSVTITLNSASQSSAKTANETGRSGESAEKNGFAEALEAADKPHTESSGKSLPTEGKLVSEGASGMTQNVPAEQIQVDLDALDVRRAGGLTLITSTEPVSQDALVGFMQDQGFSRAEMAEVLMARPEPKFTPSLVPAMTAGDWLKSKVGGDLGQPKFDPQAAPTNLANALAMQLTAPKSAGRVSPIFEILAVGDALPKIELTDEELESPVFKLGDLIPGLAAKGQSMGFGGSGSQGDSGSLFSQGERTLSEGQQQTQATEAKDFRAFLADHLRRADTLRDLSDRLGHMLARQMSGQIARGRWTLEMALHPAELGSIEIDMEMTERGLEANFRATQAVTRDLLMESMGRLKSWFEEGGIDVAYAGVSQDSGAKDGGNPTGREAQAGAAEDGVESSDTSEIDVEQWVFDSSKGLDVRV
jgi:flagellar hook-length control protein FliK